MSPNLSVEFDHRPSALVFMLNALRSSPGLPRTGGFPPIVARWRQHRVDRRQLADFLELTGLRADSHLPMMYPHVFGFRLQMVILTHPAFPIPIWRALQIRNHLLQRRPIPSNSPLDLETRVAGQRILEKGAEVDLHTTVKLGAEPIWESLNTFYYRGRFGEAAAGSTLSSAPDVAATAVAQWHLPPGVGWRLARMTGDYNGIHRWHWYARLLGFPRAFFHPQMVAGQCMAHLRPPDEGNFQRLDLWLKGPVFFDSDVSLRAETTEKGVVFALMLCGDERPAILGRWRPVAPRERLSSQPNGQMLN
jgi:acyl dehydratase